MVECVGLENRSAARYRGFESHPLYFKQKEHPVKRVLFLFNSERDENTVRLEVSVANEEVCQSVSDEDNPTLSTLNKKSTQ